MSARAGSPDRSPGGEALHAAGRVLRGHGLTRARAGVAGARGEILVVEVAAPDMPRLAELAPALKALGFRYVAVDLATVAEDATEAGDAAAR